MIAAPTIHCLADRQRRAEPRDTSVEHHQIGEPDADAAKADRETRRLSLGEDE